MPSAAIFAVDGETVNSLRRSNSAIVVAVGLALYSENFSMTIFSEGEFSLICVCQGGTKLKASVVTRSVQSPNFQLNILSSKCFGVGLSHRHRPNGENAM